MSALRFRSEVLRDSREQAGLSKAALGRLAGVARDRISSWESGIDQPSATLLPRLATALGLSPLDLLDVDPTRPPLAALRLAAGLTLQVLATQTGISYNRCRRLEHGARVPTEEELRALASALRIDVGRVRAAFASTSEPGNR